MSKKISLLRKEYMRERRRVQNLISRYRTTYGGVDISVPAIPKRITKGSINRLKSFTPKKVASKTWAVDVSTGELINLSKARKRKIEVVNFKKYLSSNITLEADISSIEFESNSEITSIKNKALKNFPQSSGYLSDVTEEIPSYSDVVIQNFYNLISNYPKSAREVVMQWFKSIENQLDGDREKLADMLQEAAEAGMWTTPEDTYKQGILYNNLSSMIKMLDISAAEQNAILKDLEWSNDFYADYY